MCVGIGSGVTLIKVTCTASSFLCAYGEHGFCMDWILRLSLRSAYGVHNFLENTKFQECVWSAWILVCKWSPGSAFGVRTFQQKKMWECVGVRRSALKDSQVRLECALLTHCYALQTHFSTARGDCLIFIMGIPIPGKILFIFKQGPGVLNQPSVYPDEINGKFKE